MIEATAAQSPVHACANDSVQPIRQSALGMLCAVQEYRGSMVTVPAEAAGESPKVYQNVAAKQVRRESRAAARIMQGEWSEEERKAWITKDALRWKEVKMEAFARWIEEEKQANDGACTFPRLEEEDGMVAAEPAMDALPEEVDVVIPGQSGAPLVIVQALLRNAEMVGNDNMEMVARDSVDGWIAGKNRSKGSFDAPAGSLVVFGVPGSGGYGPGEDRDPARLREDLAGGYVTPDGARRDYGAPGPAILLHGGGSGEAPGAPPA